jgi:hypothetical protein
MVRKLLGGVTLAALFGIFFACESCGQEGSVNGNLDGGDGGTSGSFGSSGGTSGSSGAPKECAAKESSASFTKKPVDILFVIDNSGSMSEEIREVENQINSNFASIIGASGIDYRIIMVTQHGRNTEQSVCIKAPLSGTNCSSVPASPAETATFFHHSIVVTSVDAWCKLLGSYGTADEFKKHPMGWGTLLRTEAFKVFVTISDDRMATACRVGGTAKKFDDMDTPAGATAAANAFDATLLALSPTHFGTAAKRNYVFHSIVGLQYGELSDKTKPTLPSAPLTTATCNSPGVKDAVNAGLGHQAISIKTGGLRYPSCRPAVGIPADYSPIFKEMAKGVIDGAKVACEFDVPPAPPGETLDLTTVVPRYMPSNGNAPVDFGQVPNAAACAAGKFFIEATKIKLCPATCDVVQADDKASIKVLFGCAPKAVN